MLLYHGFISFSSDFRQLHPEHMNNEVLLRLNFSKTFQSLVTVVRKPIPQPRIEKTDSFESVYTWGKFQLLSFGIFASGEDTLSSYRKISNRVCRSGADFLLIVPLYSIRHLVLRAGNIPQAVCTVCFSLFAKAGSFRLLGFHHAERRVYHQCEALYIINTKCCISSSRREYTLARDEIQPQRG